MTHQLDTWRRAMIFSVGYYLFIFFRPFQKEVVTLLPKAWLTDFNVMAVLYTGAAVLAVVLFGKEVIKGFGYFMEQPILKCFLLLLAWYVMMQASGMMADIFGSETENQASIVSAMQDVPVWARFMILGVLGPLVEEVMFRRIMITELGRLLPKWLTVVLSTVVFILIHVHALREFPIYAPLGIMIAIVYLRSGENLTYSWLLHALNNSIVVGISTWVLLK